ncbi:MAG TPA: hypothetical protein VFI42_09930 [Thermomicrobiaceae bacterium]|nr:hypothetical protein [Thermomicrobiaceae bacterium]
MSENTDVPLPRAIIVDLDGTLALLTQRGPYDYLRCHLDVVNEPVKQVVVAYRACFGKILIISGREDVARQMTAAWLERHELPFDGLFLRRRGDRRRDTVLKREIFEREIAGRYRIDFVLDDRDQVVAMWREELGLTCFQVAPGNF